MAIRERERTRSRTKAVDDETISKAKLVRRWIQLSYYLIEYKLAYYYPEYIKEGYRERLTVSDAEYEALEKEYLRLCLKLNRKNTVSHAEYSEIGPVPGKGMMEVDFTRPAVHLVLRKFGVDNWQALAFGITDEVYAQKCKKVEKVAVKKER